MKYLVYLGHPAHFHLFKNVIRALENKGRRVSVLIKKKDILEDLLRRSGMTYRNILPRGRGDNKTGMALGVVKRGLRMLRHCLADRPDLLMGTSAEIGHVGTLLRIPSLNMNEDDAAAIPLFCRIAYPWSTHILSPRICNNGKWEKKSIKYESYHELAYLHPNHFSASKETAGKYLDPGRPYFIMRLVGLGAHHDAGVRGLSDETALKVVEMLRPHGDVHITSERSLPESLEPHRLRIDPLDIHHVLAFARICIGDSQTMAAEAGVLGVPFIRFNDFVGRIGYLRELEETYGLGFGVVPSRTDGLFRRIEELLNMADREKEFQRRRAGMLEDKIDLAGFLTGFVENYPESVETAKASTG